MSEYVALSDDRWYVVSTHELTTTLEEVDRRLRLARTWLDEAGQGVARAMTTLGGVDQEMRYQAEGRGDLGAMEAALGNLHQVSQQVVEDATEVRSELDRAKGALHASDVLLAGLPAPTDTQERVDQEALRERVAQLHRAVDGARPLTDDVADRMQDTGRLAAEGLRQVREGEQVQVDPIGQQINRAQAAASELDEPVTVAAGAARRATDQAQMVAAQARLRRGDELSTRHPPTTPPPSSGFRR